MLGVLFLRHDGRSGWAKGQNKWLMSIADLGEAQAIVNAGCSPKQCTLQATFIRWASMDSIRSRPHTEGPAA
jgi:hypothetical protein